MNPGYPFAAILLLVTAGLCLCLGLAVVRTHREVLARQFSWFMLTVALYAAGYAWELSSADLASMKAALRFEYLGAPFATIFWLEMAYGYSWQRQLPPLTRAGLWLTPLLTMGIALTNELHHLFYTDLAYTRVAGMTIARIAHGPWYYVHFAYVNVCFLAGNFFFLRAWRLAQPLYRKQAAVMLAGSCIPWGGYMLYLAGWSPYGLDLTPFGLSLTGIIAATAVWYLGFLNIIPVARDAVLECIKDGVIVLDRRSRVIDFNASAARFFPELGTRPLGFDVATLLDLGGLQQAACHDQVQRLQRSDDGRTCHYELGLHPLTDSQQTRLGAVITVSDVTTEAAAEERLRQLAHHDELTGLGNRRYLMEQSGRAFALAQRHTRPLAVLIIDLDFFKQTNDEKGHLAGDEQLRGVATAMRSRLRQTDILGRYGGDEFVATLPETSVKEATQIAEILRQAVQTNLGASLSIGVAALEATHANFEALLRQADANLYRAKEAGRNRVCAGAT